MSKLDDVTEKTSPREKIIAIVVITLLLTIAIAFVIGIYFFGFAGLFNLFGVEYGSFSTLLTFILFLLIIGLFTDVFAKIPRVIFSKYFSGKYSLIASTIIIETIFAWIAIFTADEFLTDIKVPFAVELIAALVVSIAEYFLEQDDDKKDVAA